MIKQFIITKLNKFGYEIRKNDGVIPDMDPDFYPLYLQCKPYTMTKVERMYALYKAVEYVAVNKIEGDFVECGVWRGGSSMMIALTLQKYGITDKAIYMYDTYEGMSQPTENDVDFKGNKAARLLKINTIDKDIWCYATLDEVKNNMKSTKYPMQNIKFIVGKVEETIPNEIPKRISLLRLDTDWYESTNHEMNHLFPLLSKTGVLILDDYGHWQGAKKAVDDYVKKHNIALLLNRIDYSARIGIKV